MEVLRKSIYTILSSDQLRTFFNSVQAATAKLHIPIHLLGLVEETES